MENISTVGIDLSKSVFQICRKNQAGRVLASRRVWREDVIEHLKEIPAGTRVYMEACGSSHYWSREISKLGLEVRQIAPQYVKPYVKTQKNDRADAEAISEAGRCGTMKFVPVKSIAQQELQGLQRVRERLIHNRTALMNQIRGILAEQGVFIERGGAALKARLNGLEEVELAPGIRSLVMDLREELNVLRKQIEKLEEGLLKRAKGDPLVRRLCTVPGIGSLTALALVVVSGDPREFKNGRQFAAFLGLVPRQRSTGGKTKLLGITKRGDTATRTLLIHGGRAVVRSALLKKKTDPYSLWVQKLYAKYGMNHTAVAVANKNARVAWRILTSDEEFDAAKLVKAEAPGEPQGCVAKT